MPRGPSEKEMKLSEVYDKRGQAEGSFPTNPDEMSMVHEIKAGMLSDEAHQQLNEIHNAYRKKQSSR